MKNQMHSASVTVLKSQVNLVLPFRERDLNRKVQNFGAVKKLKIHPSKLGSDAHLKSISTASEKMINTHTFTLAHVKQSKQKTLLQPRSPCSATGELVQLQAMPLAAQHKHSVVTVNEMRPLTMRNERAIEAYNQSFPNSNGLILATTGAISNAKSGQWKISQNQKRHLKSTAAQTGAYSLGNQISIASGSIATEKVMSPTMGVSGIRPKEQLVYCRDDPRRSFSPTAQPSKINFEVGGDSLVDSNRINFVPLTDSISQKKQATEQRMLQWEQVKSTELKVIKLAKHRRKPSTSSSQMFNTLANEGSMGKVLSRQGTSDQFVVAISSCKGGVTGQIKKQKKLKKRKASNSSLLKQGQACSSHDQSDQAAQVYRSGLPDKITFQYAQSQEQLKPAQGTKTQFEFQGRDQKKTDGQNPKKIINLNPERDDAYQKHEGLKPQIEVDSIDPDTCKNQKASNLAGETQHVGKWLHKEIRHRLKVQHLAHVIDDPNHNSVPRNKVSTNQKVQSFRKGFEESATLSPHSISDKLKTKFTSSKIPNQPISNFSSCAIRFEDRGNTNANNSDNNQAKNLVGQKRQKSQKQLISNDVHHEQLLMTQSLKTFDRSKNKANDKLDSSHKQEPQTTTQRSNSIEEDDFVVREQRVQAKLKMFRENDKKKVLNTLSEQINNIKSSKKQRQLSHQFSTLQPVQNYTSTNDDLYKETIEKRKIREAIGKLSNNMKHAPVSIVEKKKHQKMISQIEQTVVKTIHKEQQADAGNRVSISKGMGALNESSCQMTTSPSPCKTLGSTSCFKKQTRDLEEVDFFMTSQQPAALPIYLQDSCVKTINDPKLKLETMKLDVASLQQRMHSPQTDISASQYFQHQTLDLLMRKADKFEKEAQVKINQQRQIESGGLVKLAKNFTNKTDFQKTFLRQSDTYTSPLKYRRASKDLKTDFSPDASADCSEGPKQVINNGVAEKEDRSFFMRMQRQYSQRILLMSTKNKLSKEPLLLYANQPQVIRKPSPAHTREQAESAAYTRKGISPQKIKEQCTVTISQRQKGKNKEKKEPKEEMVQTKQNSHHVKSIEQHVMQSQRKMLTQLCSPAIKAEKIAETENRPNQRNKAKQMQVSDCCAQLLTPGFKSRQVVNTHALLQRTLSGNN